MVITTTAVAFILSSLGLGFCGIRFFGAFQKIGGQQAGDKIGKLLSIAFMGTALQHGILGWGNLFFALNSEMLYRILFIDNIVLMLVTALEVYLFFYIFYPEISSTLAVVATFILGVIIDVLLIITHPLPVITREGSIEWNMSPQIEILLSFLLFVNIGALLYIFAKSYRKTESREVKIIFLVVIIVTSGGMINVFTRFMVLIGTAPDLKALIFDIVLALIGILAIATFLPFGGIVKKISDRHSRH